MEDRGFTTTFAVVAIVLFAAFLAAIYLGSRQHLPNETVQENVQ